METLHLLWFEIKIRMTNSQLSLKRPTLVHDKEVAYGKNQQNKLKLDWLMWLHKDIYLMC